jgi:sulfur carrier protein ThiS
MKVTVKLFGTLPEQHSDYNPEAGLSLSLPDGATVKDLLEKLGLTESDRCVTVVNGRVEKRDNVLGDRAAVNIFQLVTGG